MAVMGWGARRSWLLVVLALGALSLGNDGSGGAERESRTAGTFPTRLHDDGSGGAERESRTAGTSPTRLHDDGCDQSAYATHRARQHHTSLWVMNVSSIPSYLDRRRALRAIRRGAATLASARTTCPNGRALTPILPRAIYDGPTRREADITSDGRCLLSGNSDGINVVSFGPLPAGIVAVSCTYTDRDDIWQSDIRLSDAPGVFTLEPRSRDCAYRYDLEAVITHERGHSFGLSHVEEDTGGEDLTMSSILGTCDDSARTLGWGDVLGLSRIY